MDERIVHLSLPGFALKVVVDALNAYADKGDVPFKDTSVAAQVCKEFGAVLKSPFESKSHEALARMDAAVKH